MKFALNTALQLGQMITGKSKRDFVKEIKPYMKIVSKLASNIKLSDFLKF